MIIIIVIVLAIIIFALRSGSATANDSSANPSGDTSFPVIDTTSIPITGDLQTTDIGLSPIDIGGLSLSIPKAVLNWQDLAAKYSQINPILDPEEILAVIWNESSGNPTAMNPNDPSWGLMGVTSNIGRAYAGVTGSALLDPETNIKAGSGYLAYLKNLFSSSDDWAQSYNEGETNYAKGKRYNPTYSINFNARVLALKGLG